MSAGICIMNKHAIALAADSAVTIGNHQAIHNSANKLFSLSDTAPIGAIIYANADMEYVPMEIILKQYRKYLGDKTFDTLKRYLGNFIDYLIKQKKFFHFDKNEKRFVEHIYKNLLAGLEGDYKRGIETKINEKGDELSEEEVSEISNRALQGTIDFVNQLPDNNLGLRDYIKEKYSLQIEKYIKSSFKWVRDDRVEELIASVCLVFDKNFLRPGYVGLAFAGYGEKEIFPKMLHITVSGVISDKVIYSIFEERSITEMDDASITPLAQKDVMQTFLFGINDELINALGTDIPNQLAAAFKTIDTSYFAPGKKKEVENAIKHSTQPIITNIVNSAINKFMNPILRSVGTLPIEELALLAESMINITSVRRKVALDSNIGTVGGPIDLAVITKSEGFCWIKQKNILKKSGNDERNY